MLSFGVARTGRKEKRGVVNVFLTHICNHSFRIGMAFRICMTDRWCVSLLYSKLFTSFAIVKAQ